MPEWQASSWCMEDDPEDRVDDFERPIPIIRNRETARSYIWERLHEVDFDLKYILECADAFDIYISEGQLREIQAKVAEVERMFFEDEMMKGRR